MALDLSAKWTKPNLLFSCPAFAGGITTFVIFPWCSNSPFRRSWVISFGKFLTYTALTCTNQSPKIMTAQSLEVKQRVQTLNKEDTKHSFISIPVAHTQWILCKGFNSPTHFYRDLRCHLFKCLLLTWCACIYRINVEIRRSSHLQQSLWAPPIKFHNYREAS